MNQVRYTHTPHSAAAAIQTATMTSARHPVPRPALLQNRSRDHSDRKHDPERDQYEIVEVSQDRNKVRDEVDGAQRIGYDARDQKLRVPGRAGVARGEPEDESLALEASRALFEAGEQRHRPRNSGAAGFHG